MILAVAGTAASAWGPGASAALLSSAGASLGTVLLLASILSAILPADCDRPYGRAVAKETLARTLVCLPTSQGRVTTILCRR